MISFSPEKKLFSTQNRSKLIENALIKARERMVEYGMIIYSNTASYCNK
jgi:hypothetical protein